MTFSVNLTLFRAYIEIDLRCATTAETLIGLTNTFGSLTGFMAPAVVGTITNRNVRMYFINFVSCRRGVVNVVNFADCPRI